MNAFRAEKRDLFLCVIQRRKKNTLGFGPGVGVDIHEKRFFLNHWLRLLLEFWPITTMNYGKRMNIYRKRLLTKRRGRIDKDGE